VLGLSFDDLFENVGTPALGYRDAAALDGHQVTIAGYVVEAHGRPDRFLLVSTPGACAHCSGAPVAAIDLPGLAAGPFPARDDAPRLVTGRLGVGYRVDEAGEASFVRLHDAAIAPRDAPG